MAGRVEKPVADRIRECVAILKKLTDELGIDPQNPSIQVLKKRMGEYWRNGKLAEEVLPLFGYDRSILYKFPRWSNQSVQMMLKVNKVAHPRLPADLEEFLKQQSQPDSALNANAQPMHQQPLSDPAAAPAEQTNSVTQSDPSHPSLPA